jgi:hypothetical protein
MHLFQNKWPALTDTEKILRSLVDEPTGAPLADNNEVKKCEKRMPNKEFQEISFYLAGIANILDISNPGDYYYLPLAIFQDLEAIRLQTSGSLSLIRTIRAIYKNNNAFQAINDVLGKLLQSVNTIIQDEFQLWMGKHRDELQTEPFHPTIPMDWENLPTIAHQLWRIKRSSVELNKNSPKWLETFSFWTELQQLFKNTQKKTGKSSIPCDEIFQLPLFAQAPGLADENIRKEVIYYLFNNQFFSERFSPKSTENGKDLEKTIRTELTDFRDHLLNSYLNATLPLIELILDPKQDLLKQLPQLYLDRMTVLEQQLTAELSGDLKQVHARLPVALAKYFDHLTQFDSWLQQLLPLFNPHENLIKTILRSTDRIQKELEVRIEQFGEYARTIEEESNRTDLNQLITEKIDALNNILKSYEEQVGTLLDQKLPMVNQIIALFQQYTTQFQAIKADMTKIFKEYRDKEINLFSSLKTWEEQYDAVRNRTRFVITSAMNDFLEKIKPLVQEEQEFVKKLADLSATSDIIPIQFELEMLIPERLTEKELRDRITALDQKLSGLDHLRQIYEMQREKYHQLFTEYRKTHDNIENKQCVICRKVVDVVDDHFIRCNFCGSMMHYACGAMWINKYNACPVCHNNYTVPHNEVFDPEELEPDKID